MTKLYHSFCYRNYVEDLSYEYENDTPLNKSIIKSTVDFQTEIKYLISTEETAQFGIIEIYPFGNPGEPDNISTLLTYVLEEKFLESSGAMLDILEDSFKLGKISMRDNVEKGYLALIRDEMVPNGEGYLTVMTGKDLEVYFSTFKDKIIEKAVQRELYENGILWE